MRREAAKYIPTLVHEVDDWSPRTSPRDALLEEHFEPLSLPLDLPAERPPPRVKDADTQERLDRGAAALARSARLTSTRSGMFL